MSCGCKLDGTRCDLHKERGETWHLIVAAETKAQKRVEKLESSLAASNKALDVAEKAMHSLDGEDCGCVEDLPAYGDVQCRIHEALAEIKKLRGGE